MATMQNNSTSSQQQREGTGTGTRGMTSGEGVGSPISNDAYNVLTALQSKLEGMEAYRKYQKDGSGEIWQKLSQADHQCVELLVGELERLVRDGKFRNTRT